MSNSHLHSYHWLASDDGKTAIDAAVEMRLARLPDLKIGERLRQSLTAEQAALVLTQLDLHERGQAKFTRANEMLFTRAGLEQATSEVIANYRAERYQNSERIVDLCCGIGGDLMALARIGRPVVAVDLDPVHLLLAGYNAGIHHPVADIDLQLQDVQNMELRATDSVFLDPARRTQTGKRIGYQSEPSIEWAFSLANRVSGVGIKTAPGIPEELVPEGWEIEHIAVGHDLKEGMLWSPSLATAVRHRATLIGPDAIHSITSAVHTDMLTVSDPQPGQWLHDVNPAVTNAGLVRELALEMHATMIDPEIGFLVTDGDTYSPFTSRWRILQVMPWHEKQIRKALVSLDAGPIDIRRRGLAGDVPAITKRLRGNGSQRLMIAMTRVKNAPTAIICAME